MTIVAIHCCIPKPSQFAVANLRGTHPSSCTERGVTLLPAERNTIVSPLVSYVSSWPATVQHGLVRTVATTAVRLGVEIDDATLPTTHHHARAISRNWTLGKLRMIAGFASVMWLSPSGPRSKFLSSTEGLTTDCGQPTRSGAGPLSAEPLYGLAGFRGGRPRCQPTSARQPAAHLGAIVAGS